VNEFSLIGQFAHSFMVCGQPSTLARTVPKLSLMCGTGH